MITHWSVDKKYIFENAFQIHGMETDSIVKDQGLQSIKWGTNQIN